jgi:hypothetical protein
MIDHARIAADIDSAGNWKPKKSLAQMLAVDQSISFGLRFFTELQKRPVPIPLELIQAADKKYRLMDYILFLYWRSFAAHTKSFIPWRYLYEQFDNNHSRPNRWPLYFRQAARILKSLPDPINQIQVDVSTAGLTIHPLPVGTTFFDGKPKLGYKNEQGTVLNLTPKTRS